MNMNDLIRVMSGIHLYQERIIEKNLRESGYELSTSSLKILDVCNKHPEGILFRDLAKDTFLSKSSLSLTNNNTLIDKYGYLKRDFKVEKSRDDLYYMTKEAKPCLKAYNKIAKNLEKIAFNDVSASDRKVFEKVLDQIVANYREEIK